MRKIVVNSTPLIILCGIGRLCVLKELYNEITILEAVFNEVTAKENSACMQIEASDWIHIEGVKNQSEKKQCSKKTPSDAGRL